MSRQPPHNVDAERAVLGAMLRSRAERDAALSALSGDDFYRPQHRAIFRALLDVTASGQLLDPIVLLARLHDLGDTTDGAALDALRLQAPLIVNVPAEASLLARLAACRRAIATCETASDAAWAGDLDAVVDALFVDVFDVPLDVVDPPITASALAAEDHAVDWIVPGWLARHETILFVAEPGSGKTTLLNQIAMLIACGLHPWSRVDLLTKRRVLVFDFQDSRGARGRHVQHLLGIAGDRYPVDDTLFYELRTQGLDLTQPRDQRWFEAKCAGAQPDVIIAGPLYNMVRGATSRAKHSEETAEIAGSFLSELCMRRNCALLIEAHAPHGDELRVRGSKFWEDWAGWGIGLKASYVDDRREFALVRFRGDREDGRSWPTRFVQGHPGLWPWEAVGTPNTPDPNQEKF